MIFYDPYDVFLQRRNLNGDGFVEYPLTVIKNSFVTVDSNYNLVCTPFCELLGSGSVSASYTLTSSFTQFAVSAAYAPGSPSVSASYALTASYAINGGTGGFTLTTGSTYPITSSWANNAVTSSFAISASKAISASYAATSSNAINAVTANSATSASNSTTSSYSLVAITATSASNAITAAFALNVGSAATATSASYALTSSFALNAGSTVSASYALSASNARTASFALTANLTSASYALTSSYAFSSSYSITSSNAKTASFAISASWAPSTGGGGGNTGVVLQAEYSGTVALAAGFDVLLYSSPVYTVPTGGLYRFTVAMSATTSIDPITNYNLYKSYWFYTDMAGAWVSATQDQEVFCAPGYARVSSIFAVDAIVGTPMYFVVSASNPGFDPNTEGFIFRATIEKLI